MGQIANPGVNKPVVPNYPKPQQNSSSTFLMMQIMMQFMQLMMTQFQGGQTGYSPYGAPGGYSPQQPGPFNFYGGGGQNFLV